MPTIASRCWLFHPMRRASLARVRTISVPIHAATRLTHINAHGLRLAASRDIRTGGKLEQAWVN
jgi:hypothetical protein